MATVVIIINHWHSFYAFNWILSLVELLPNCSPWFVNSLHMFNAPGLRIVLTAAFNIIFHWSTCVLSPHAAAAKTGCVCCLLTGRQTHIMQWMEVIFYLFFFCPSSVLRQQQLLWPTYWLVNRHTLFLSHTRTHIRTHAHRRAHIYPYTSCIHVNTSIHLHTL